MNCAQIGRNRNAFIPMEISSPMARMGGQRLRQIHHHVGCRKYLILLVSATAGVGTLVLNTPHAKSSSAIQVIIVVVFIYALFTPAIKTRKVVVSKKYEEKSLVVDEWMNDKKAAKSTEKQSKKKTKRKHVVNVALDSKIVAKSEPQIPSRQSAPTSLAIVATVQVTELSQEDDGGFELVTKRVRPQKKKPDNTHIAEISSKVEQSTATKKPAVTKGSIASKKPVTTTKLIDSRKPIEESAGCKEWDLDSESENVKPSAKPIIPKSMVEIVVPQQPSTELVGSEQSGKPVLSLQTTKCIVQPVVQRSTEKSRISEPSVPENSDPALQRQMSMPPSELPLANDSTVVSPGYSSESFSDASNSQEDSSATTPEIKSTEVEKMCEYSFTSNLKDSQEHVLKPTDEDPAVDAEPEVVAPEVSEHNIETFPVEDKPIISTISENPTKEEPEPKPEETNPTPEEAISVPEETVSIPKEAIPAPEETFSALEEKDPVPGETASAPALEEAVRVTEQTSPISEDTGKSTANELFAEVNSLVPASVDSVASNVGLIRTWASVVGNKQTWAEMDEEDRENGVI